ncbi:MAG: hypothetical protein HY277_07005 [Ignavibacteriales bacterium]|nr:hypothetical protein [Ignavibacteriales bacterium]
MHSISQPFTIIAIGCLLALAVVNEHYGLLITFSILGSVGLFYLSQWQQRCVVSPLHSNGAARNFIIVVALGIVGLNLIALFLKDYSIHQVLASILLCISAYPFWKYLREREGNIPFVPFIAMVYGIYYGTFIFLPFEHYKRLMHTSDEAATESLLLTTIGLAILLLTYYKWPRTIWQGWVPQFSIHWSEPRAKQLAVVLGVIGLIITTITRLIDVPVFVASFVYFLNQLSLLAIVILFFIQLNGRLQLSYRLFLWGMLVPLQLLIDIGTGFVFQPFRSVVILAMTYILVKQRVPWRAIIILLILAFPLLATKAKFRALTWQDSAPVQENPIGKGIEFMGLAGSSFTRVDKDSLFEMSEVVAQRVNLHSTFAFVIEQTPSIVPYWGGETYSTILWRFIPRLLVPDKPQEGLGQGFGHRYGLLDLEDIRSSYNLPQLVEMYINFGTIGVVVGMFVLGLVYSVLQHLLNHYNAGEWGQISAIIIFSSLINIESNFVPVYGGIIYWVVLLWTMGFLIRKRENHIIMYSGNIKE